MLRRQSQTGTEESGLQQSSVYSKICIDNTGKTSNSTVITFTDEQKVRSGVSTKMFVRNNKLMQNSKKELQYVDNTLARSLQIHKRKWTTEEQMKFTRLYKQYKKDFKQYVPYFDGRTEGQIKSFYQNVVHNNKVKRNSNEQCVNEQRDHSQLDVDLPLIVFDAIDFQLM
ncbi:SANT/Myb_domain [Hexamita inflata]|uniref:SANT/Myb domain n=1 Tax=Hexamita inflata TaxID=28002 RepID=A0AA86R5N2_9EUKA|nr:SANT/Myb domain [Hexamita inflata]